MIEENHEPAKLMREMLQHDIRIVRNINMYMCLYIINGKYENDTTKCMYNTYILNFLRDNNREIRKFR